VPERLQRTPLRVLHEQRAALHSHRDRQPPAAASGDGEELPHRLGGTSGGGHRLLARPARGRDRPCDPSAAHPRPPAGRPRVARIRKLMVGRDAGDRSQVPDALRAVTDGPEQLLPQVKIKRTFEFNRSEGAWQINGEFFDESRISAKPHRNSAEIWELKSPGG